MRRTRFSVPLFISLLLLFSTAMVQAQQPGATSQQFGEPSSAAPVPLPQATLPQQQAPPAQNLQSNSEANQRIQRSVEDLLSGDQLLSNADVEVAVDDVAITLTGYVDGYAQHSRVMALVQQYARYRQIVDKIKQK